MDENQITPADTQNTGVFGEQPSSQQMPPPSVADQQAMQQEQANNVQQNIPPPVSPPLPQYNDPSAQIQLSPKANPLQSPSNPAGLPPTPPLTYVEGVGLLGPDLGGYVKGVQAYQNLAQNQQNQQIQATSFNEAQFNREKEQTIQAGMSDSAQQGGYPAVIDYLLKADPARAIQFNQAKVGLDNSILQNKVMQATSQRDVASAMVTSYGLLGKMGYSISHAPPDQQQSLYQAALPMIKTVNPNAPDSYGGEAQSMFVLAGAQAMPAAFAYMGTAALLQGTENIGKMSAEYSQRLAMGYDPRDPVNMMPLANGMAALGLKNEETRANTTQAQLNSAATPDKALQLVNKNLQDSSDAIGYTQAVKAFPAFQTANDALQKNPNDSIAKYNLLGAVKAMMSQSPNRPVKDADALSMGQQDESYNKILNKYNENRNGTAMVVSPGELSAVRSFGMELMQRKNINMENTESKYKDMVANNPILYKNPNLVNYPSSNYYNQISTQTGAKVDNNIAQQQYQQLPPANKQAVDSMMAQHPELGMVGAMGKHNAYIANNPNAFKGSQQ